MLRYPCRQHMQCRPKLFLLTSMLSVDGGWITVVISLIPGEHHSSPVSYFPLHRLGLPEIAKTGTFQEIRSLPVGSACLIVRSSQYCRHWISQWAFQHCSMEPFADGQHEGRLQRLLQCKKGTVDADLPLPIGGVPEVGTFLTFDDVGTNSDWPKLLTDHGTWHTIYTRGFVKGPFILDQSLNFFWRYRYFRELTYRLTFPICNQSLISLHCGHWKLSPWGVIHQKTRSGKWPFTLTKHVVLTVGTN